MRWEKARKQKENIYEIPFNWLFVHYYEALSVLFRIENALRIFVYVILKNELKEKWSELSITSDDADTGTISSIGKRRISQAKTFGYLGYTSTCPVMYLTSGELIRLITSESYWKYFRGYFPASKQNVSTKLEEIGNIRNALAHFRPIREDDVEVIKQNSNQVLPIIEKCLEEMISCSDVVPTNTTDPWYQELRTLGNEYCKLSFSQSSDQDWVKLRLLYGCPLISSQKWHKEEETYRVLNLKSPQILSVSPALTNLLIFLSESGVSALRSEEGSPKFNKKVNMVFGRATLSNSHAQIKAEIENILLNLAQESDLVKEDNLARGLLVESVHASAHLVKPESANPYWYTDCKRFVCEVREDDPPEYWGGFSVFSPNFISATENYPWMPISVSSWELPF